MSASIFTLTSVSRLPAIAPPRCWGWLPTLEEAESAVARNDGGMDDCLYDWLVIEEVASGIIAVATARQWYRWDGESEEQKWVKTEVPDWSVGTVNWGIG